MQGAQSKQGPSTRNPRWAWIAFTAGSLAGIGMFFVPAFIIRPFRYQSPHALWLAMAMRQRAPLITSMAVVLCAIFAVAIWKRANRWDRAFAGLMMLLLVFSAVMSRINYFEWMFHPAGNPRFESETQSKLDAAEMIMAVRFGQDARAYPIREMAYHHVVNDVVGGVPVTVTY